MNTEVGYTIYLPPEYNSNPGQRFNVIYYAIGQVQRIALCTPESYGVPDENDGNYIYYWDKYAPSLPPTIIVLINPGHDTKYQDAIPGSLMFGLMMPESTFIQELIPYIDSHYRTRNTQGGRAITGFSGGGNGSLRFALKYPYLFSSVAAMSGAIGNNGSNMMAIEPELLRYMFSNDPWAFDAQTVFSLARANRDNIIKSGIGIYMVVGSEDVLVPLNSQLDSLMSDLGIPHNPLVIVPGMGHDYQRGPETLQWMISHFY
jgi:enterochelin esterase-like enzyme